MAALFPTPSVERLNQELETLFSGFIANDGSLWSGWGMLALLFIKYLLEAEEAGEETSQHIEVFPKALWCLFLLLCLPGQGTSDKAPPSCSKSSSFLSTSHKMLIVCSFSAPQLSGYQNTWNWDNLGC